MLLHFVHVRDGYNDGASGVHPKVIMVAGDYSACDWASCVGKFGACVGLQSWGVCCWCFSDVQSDYV